ncbi:MAG TPA: insulinase family protein, partial [Polyangiaceae bacterium]
GEVVDHLRALVYAKSPLGKSVVGTARSLRALTIDDAVAFASARYRPSSMTVAISGAFGDTNALVAPFATIPSPASPPPASPGGFAKQYAVVDAAGIEHVPSSVPAPELWLGWALPGAYGASAATLEIIADMASGALASGAWDRHADITSGFCFLDRGGEASMLACRAFLSSTENVGAVERSILNVVRKGIATRASQRDWRYLFTRGMATEELLSHERLLWRTQELVLGAHFAHDPGFSLKRVRGIETTESDALMALYDRTLRPETTRAVLAVPGSAAELAPLPLASALESRGADLPDPQRLLANIETTDVSERVLANGLRVLVGERRGAAFQTALLGFFDGAPRVPPAVVDAARWSYRSYIVEPPRGVLQTLHWDEDSTCRIVRGPAGDPRVLFDRLAEGLENYDFDWKNEAYLDFTHGQKQRENDPREKTPRDFRKQLFFEHPYGAAVVSADVDAVTVRQIRDWYDAVHRPENALLVLVGPEDPEAVFRAAADELGGWQRQAKREPPVPPRNPLVAGERTGLRLLVGDRPTESQVTLEVGCALPPGTAASAPVEDVLVRILGAQLDDELRQRTGATYGVHVWLERLRGGTTVLHAESAVANELFAPALKAFYGWFVENDERVTEGMLRIGRFDAIQGYVVGTETSVDLANELFEYARRNLSTVDLDEHPKRIAAVDLDAIETLLTACRKTSLFSAVGDERRIRAAWRSALDSAKSPAP